MASLLDFYRPAAVTPQFQLAEIGVQGGYATEDAGISQSRMKRNFETRTLPSLVNREAAKGSFYSGGAGVRADQAREDYLNESGDVSRMLQRKLADLSRQRVYATLGVSV